MATEAESKQSSSGQLGSGLTSSLRILLVIAAVAIIVPFMREYASLVNSFVLAMIIVMTVSPIMNWLRERGVPDGLAFLFTMFFTLVLTTVLALSAIVGLVKMVQVLNEYGSSMERIVNSVNLRLTALGVEAQPLFQIIDPQRVLVVLGSLVSALLSGVSFVALLAVIVVFMLGEALTFPQKLEAQLDLNSPFFPQVYTFSQTIRRYVTITAGIGAVSGVIVWLVLWLLGVESAALWGLLYFITSFIPNVGFWLALIPPFLIAGLQYGTGMAIVVLLFYMVFSGIINQGVRPTYMGQGLDLSPLWVILSLVIWSTILGVPGIIIGVPLTVMVKELLLETSSDTQWLAGLMGTGLGRGGAESSANLTPASRRDDLSS